LETSDKTADLLSKQATALAEYFSKLADMYAIGPPTEAGILKLSEDLLDPKALQPIANLVMEEMALKGGPSTDKLMLLSEQGEMLASLCKEYYVIHNRKGRIQRAAEALSGMKHLGGKTGVVLNRIKQAGGAY